MKRGLALLPSGQDKRRKDENSTASDSSTAPLDASTPLQSARSSTPATSDSDIPSQTRAKSIKRARGVDDEASSYGDGSGSSASGTRRRKVQRELCQIAPDGLAFPRSAYEGGTPPAEQFSEIGAIQPLLKAHATLVTQDESKPEFTYFQLDNFSIYRPPDAKHHELELVSLDRLSQDRYPKFMFDGILSVGDERCYVQNVVFRVLTIDGYGEKDSTDLANQLCIQSPIAQRNDVWYKLGKPAPEYRRFYQPFLWLARFTKHFVDYLLETEQVSLQHFRQRFHKWLAAQYHDKSFESWIAAAGTTDFRVHVAAHFAFLYKECWSIEFSLFSHPLWGEIDANGLKAIPAQPNLKMRTIVTPYAYDCFRWMYFGNQLERQAISESVLQETLKRKERLRLTLRHQTQPQDSDRIRSPDAHRDSPEPVIQVSQGDVIRVTPDEGTRWRFKTNAWFAYVQNVRSIRGRTLLDVLWLYQPRHTTLGKSFYPFENELFMSDHCECGKDALDLDCVIDKVDVSWFTRDPYAEASYFVRQKYRTVAELDTYDFIALEESDFTCHCDHHVPVFEECRNKYSRGDTVLVRQYKNSLGEDRLQPSQVVSFDDEKMTVQLRMLVRKSEINPEPATRPNELLLTEDIIDKAPSMIIRKCHVRFFSHEQVAAGDLVTPYDRNGTGDFWFIAGKQQQQQPALEEDSSPRVVVKREEHATADEEVAAPLFVPPLAQGWDPKAAPSKSKLTGMGIFCGGGIFDRGLEEGGAVKFRYAVDWAEHALHSYRANVQRRHEVNYFLGSVDDYLAQAMAGIRKDCIAEIGAIQVISAGSPCPGFSTMQSDPNSEQSRRNASMVASVVSFVDLYVPQYLVLENVVNMTNSNAGPNKDENVFSQILAALVGLGYQVQQFLMDAWSYGSAQNRSRVFIVASAPGLSPLPQPCHSHAHPPMINERSLGKADNGLAFGRRRKDFTPFQHVPAAELVADLPYVGDSQPQLCTKFPDHRTATLETNVNRHRMACVPTRPAEMGLIRARDAGVLRGEPLEYCARVNKIRGGKNSKMYKRIHPDRLVPTILTKCLPQDGVAGQYVHWNQHRVITIMEARRAQGFLDHEVLIGTPTHQMKIVGNSVVRKVALMLGLGLRDSWMGSSVEEDGFEDAAKFEDEDEMNDDDDDEDDDGDDDEVQVLEREKFTVEESPVVSQRNLDNRSAKIALLDLTDDNLGDIKRNGFKAINRIFAEKAAQGHLQSSEQDLRAGGSRAQLSL